ncbi:MFS transporter [Dactylosporangium sp. NPDC051484]|uniref:MFS transporter n=1 Tax=Dactylosporangium sp. NPDC051484 TaxID=3154942 RepID=UPI003450CDA1
MKASTAEVPLRRLLTHGGYWRWSLATQLIRLPAFMAPMAYVLASVHLMGGPGLGAIVLAVMLVVGELSAPFAGRVIDRLGVARWAPRSLLLSAFGRLVLAGLFALQSPTWLLVVVVTVFSCVGSGAGGIVRVMLGRTVPEEMLPKALAIDSSMVELVIVAAPFLVTVAAFGGGLAPVILMSVFSAVGAILLWDRRAGRSAAVAQPPEPAGQRPEGSPAAIPEAATPDLETARPVGAQRRRSLWRNREYVFWVLVAIAFGHLLGTAETGALPLALHLGANNAVAAVLIAVLAGASAVSGIAYAVWSNRIRLSNNVQAVGLIVLMVGSCALIAFGPGWPAIVAGFFLLGVWTAPINTVRSYAAGLVIPKDRQVEGFALIDTANGIGFALAALLLAVLPVEGMLAAGSLTGVLAILLAPVLLGSEAAFAPVRRWLRRSPEGPSQQRNQPPVGAETSAETSADERGVDAPIRDVLTVAQQTE